MTRIIAALVIVFGLLIAADWLGQVYLHVNGFVAEDSPGFNFQIERWVKP